ncbi:MAG TPA: glycoside hydrolase family 16 protein [Deinococcales bacterium]|nr:glycoside hydrolase family 16 protein [Deinococcales bacterium]
MRPAPLLASLALLASGLAPTLAAPALPAGAAGALPAGAAKAVNAAAALAPRDTPPDPAGWRLTWHDEFNGRAGAGPNPSKWVFDLGGGGWGNSELEEYRAENAIQDGKGNLVITARKLGPDAPRCGLLACEYSSARLKTQGIFSQAYGRFEARVQVPGGAGLWPAFWMLGADIADRGWPAAGEIDIMENIGREPNQAHGTIHGPGYSGGSAIGAPYLSTEPLSRTFHTFGIDWTPDRIAWAVDGNVYETRTPADLPPNTRWVFDHPMFLILNLAVGGSWPGRPNDATPFPARMVVDWVRVYTPAGK